MEDTQVLPKGVRSFMFKQGLVGNIANRFGNDTSLYSLDSRLSKNFDAEEILNFHARAPELVETLNQAVPYSMGKNIQLGELRFGGEAQVTYSAPVLAYGITNNWTLGFAVPFAKLDADISVQSGGNNNLEEIYNGLAEKGNLNAELDAAYQRLRNIDLRQAFYDYLSNKSYKSLEADDSWQLGDIQIVSKYRYFDKPKYSLLNKVTITLPTGAEDDPNQLLDIPIFHRRSIEISQVQDYRIDKKNTIGSSIGYQWNMADRIAKRVPLNEDDHLPNLDRLEDVNRDIGDVVKWEINYRTAWTDAISTGVSYLGEKKAKDTYSGNRAYNYSLLSSNTDANVHKFELLAAYSSVNSYLKKKATIPFGVSYRYSNLFAGANVERQLAHELTLMVFF